MSSSACLLIRTPGYWPLPEFVQFHDGKKWAKLKLKKRASEKEAEYKMANPIRPSPSILILEASITKALPKKLRLFIGKRKFILSRWIGGLYSNLRAGSSQRSVRAFYDAIAPRYPYHVEPGRAHQLAAFLPFILGGSKVLDASAGDCTLAKVAMQRRPDLQLWCSDISKGMLGLSSACLPSSRLVVSPASRLPFPASSFDAVLHTYSNLHPADRQFFRSFARVLRPGGLLLYHPVKAPGEQWPKHLDEQTREALQAAGFASVSRLVAHAEGARRRSTLVFYLARR